MKTTNSQEQSVPTAFITVRKGRLKIYDKQQSPTVYLQNQTEFEIELVNNSAITQLAKIEINGKFISTSGIIVRPGERVYLERYLDSPNKFKFDTYTVQANNAAVQKAIENNGSIRIQFFAEQEKNNFILRGNTYGSGNITTTIGNYPFTNTTNTSYSSNIKGITTSNFGGTFETNSIPCNDSTFTSNSTTLDSLGFFNSETKSFHDTGDKNVPDFGKLNEDAPKETGAPRRRLSKTLKETGRIEEGSKSDQKFEYVNKSFNYWANATVEYKILPISEKNVTASEIKKFCTECGANLKSSFKFCPVCGEKA